jgi:hypothetical protein
LMLAFLLKILELKHRRDVYVVVFWAIFSSAVDFYLIKV